MTKPWDESMKKLVAASPQQFVSWFLPGGRFIELFTIEFPTKDEEPHRTDMCMAVELEGKQWICLFEFQSTNDPEIDVRLLAYSLRIHRYDPQHRPVCACVTYLRNVGQVKEPPLQWGPLYGLSRVGFCERAWERDRRTE